MSYQAHGKIPGKEEEMNDEGIQMVAVMIPVVAIVSVFTFSTLAVWFGIRLQERRAFYKAETLRRITESSGEGAQAALELLREDDRLKRIRTREGLKLGGLINLAVGVALIIFLWALVPAHGVYLCGLIPGLVGVAMLGYVRFLAAPLE
jgi:hypothetical protein